MALAETITEQDAGHTAAHAALKAAYDARGNAALPTYTTYGTVHAQIHNLLHAEHNVLGAATVLPLNATSGHLAHHAALNKAQNLRAAAATPVNLFTTQTPASADLNDGQGITLSTRFTANADGNVTGVRFYRATTAPSSAIGLLYSDAGVELARATFGTLAAGWNTVSFAAPVAITAGSYYRAAYWSSGPYVVSTAFFAAPVTNGNLTGTGGYYGYGASPASGTGQFNNSAYFADVAYVATGVPAAATAPATPAAPTVTPSDSSLFVSWVAPANGGSAITGYDVQPFAGATAGAVVSVGNVSGVNLTGLTNGTAYTVRVRAKNAVGNSAYSAASAAATPAVASSVYPDASTTGVPSGTALTAYTGSAGINTAGTIIENKTITIGLVIGASANNVIIRNCRIDVGQNYNWCIDASNGATGTQILDCTLIGGVDSTVAGNYVMRRCDISGSGDGLKVGTVDVQDCYIHDLIVTAESHNDGMQCLGTNSLTIRHNRIVLFGGTNAAIILSTGSADTMQNVLIDNNLLGGGGYTVFGGYQAGSDNVSKVANIVISNNKFTTAVYANSGAFGPLTSVDPPVSLSNNTWYDGPKVGQSVT